MANITMNFKKNAIEITKAFEKKASIYGSAEYRELIDMKLSYGEIKQWFIEIYPVFKDCVTRAQWVLAA